MKKFYFLAALVAGTALTSCTSEDDLALSPPEVNNVEDGYVPIVFSSLKNNITRGDITGKSAADSLGNQFVTFGYKGTKTGVKTPNIVFDNYLVVYQENSANKTESDSTNWEYVDKGLIKHAIDRHITKQTIKYWDYSQPQYDFIAWSTGKKTPKYEGDPTADEEVLVSAINPVFTETSANSGKYNITSAYTFTGTAKALRDCYVADLVTVYKKKKEAGTGDTYNVVWDGYQKPVTLKFRQLGTKVRIGFYETIPGYSVKNVRFYPKAGQLSNANEITETPTIFTTEANQIFTSGTYTVTFPTVDDPTNADNNKAHISFQGTGTQDTKVEWGKALDYTFRENGETDKTEVYLGRTSNTASFAGDPENNYYVVYLPNEVGVNLNLRVDYTLESIDGGGELIEVKNSSAQVPLIYTQWKPGYAYTYLFKISDKTNGRTGPYDPTKPDDDDYNSDPAGLWPITFDAVVVNAEEDATQETITTISTPSITTYQKGSKVVDNNEYTNNGNNIFVTVNEDNALVALSATNAKLYSLENVATEAEVVDALSFQDDVTETGATITGRSGLSLTEVTPTGFVEEIEYGADGNKIKNLGNGRAMSFAPTANTTYAFIYEKTAGTTENKYQPVTKTEGQSVGDNVYRYALKAAATTTPSDVKKGVTYFAKGDGTEGAITPFLGQNVGNLYLNNTGTQQAYGYAKSGTDYYYTDNNGLNYKKAKNIEYASFKDATDLYTLDGTTPTLKTDASPVPGTAYYQKTSVSGVETYTYCVILPQQEKTLYVIDTDETKIVAATGNAVKGMIYLDKYTYNSGVRYAKVIKVQ